MEEEIYDEDLLNNPFLKALQKFKDVYAQAIENLYVICVPSEPSLQDIKINLEFIQTHILMPSSSGAENEMVTLNDKMVRIENKTIKTLASFKEPRIVKILFEESYYNSKDESYRVLCLERPLEGGRLSICETVNQVTFNTFEDCSKYLHSDPITQKYLGDINEKIFKFKLSLESFNSSLQALQQSCESIYSTSLTGLTKQLNRASKIQKNYDADKLKLSLETYILGETFHEVFEKITEFYFQEDTTLNQISKRLLDIGTQQLSIPNELFQRVPIAVEILSSIVEVKTPLEKLTCLKKTILSVTTGSTDPDESITISSDELLPLIILIIINSEIPNWKAMMNYIENFRFSDVYSDDLKFIVSSFQAAIEYLQNELSTQFLKTSAGTENGIEKRSLDTSDIVESQSLPTLSRKRTETMVREEPESTTTIEILFDETKKGNLKQVSKFLTSTSKRVDLESFMCHPLCDCSKCSKLIAANNAHSINKLSIYSKDSQGCTILHICARFGQAQIMKFVLELGSVVNGKNNHGQTPLHIACLKNHVDCVKQLLLHPDIDVYTTDKFGNTSLHYCALANHVEVIQVLLDKDSKHPINIDIQNLKKETPLHIACKFGYEETMKCLINLDASLDVKNKDDQTPENLIGTKKLRKIFEKTKERAQTKVSIWSNGSSITENGTHDDIELTEEVEKLFRTIEEGDIELVRYKLKPGVKTVEVMSSLCHPLCQCEKCQKVEDILLETNGTDTLKPKLTTSSRGNGGLTLLHVAALHQQEDICRMLLSEFDANVNIRTSHGLTPLHYATQAQNVNIISLLIKDYHALVNIQSSNYNSPLHLCSSKEAARIFFEFADPKPNLNLLNKKGETPLHIASKLGDFDLVEYYLQMGANPFMRNNFGQRPCDIASNPEIVHLLQPKENEIEQQIERQIEHRQLNQEQSKNQTDEDHITENGDHKEEGKGENQADKSVISEISENVE